MDNPVKNKPPDAVIHRRLSLRLAGYAIFVGLLLGLTLSALQMTLNLLEERRHIDETLMQVVNTVREPAVRAAYEIDAQLARSIVDGLFQYDPIKRVRVMDDYGTALADREKIRKPEKLDWLVRWTFGGERRVDMSLTVEQGRRTVGRITVTADSRFFAMTFFSRAAATLAGDMIQNILLAGILAFIFYYRVARPLRLMAWQVSQVDPSDPAARLLTAPASHKNDELGFLAHSINHLLTGSAAGLGIRKAAEERLQRQNEYMAALHETAVGLIGRLDLNELLQALVSRAMRLTRAEDGFLYLYNAEEKCLEMKAGCGAVAEMIGYRIHPGEGLCGRTWASGEIMRVSDYQTWPYRLDAPRFSNMRAVVNLPIKSRPNLPGGVLGLAHEDPGAQFDEADIEILKRFAELASVALENARLYTRLHEELAERRRAEQEREHIEAQFLHIQKIEAIGTLAGGVAHDFNNILVPIIGFAELARRQLRDDPDKVLEHIGEILNAAERARDLAGQILSFSRKSDGEQKCLSIQPILKETLKLLKATLPSTIQIQESIDPDCPPALINPSQIHQVIMNLCTNAFHAMRETGGVLEVSLEQWENKELGESQDLKPGPYIRISVRDTGCGMDSKTIQRVFEPYFTTKPAGEGTGMGLSVAYGLIKGHGGNIAVESRLGEGSVIHVDLPASPPPDQVSEQGQTESSLPRGKESILLVDDEALVARVETTLLKELGYNATMEIDGLNALNMIQKAPHDFDLLITDMTMPGISGFELAQKVAAIRSDLPVILCSGFSNAAIREKAAKAGITCVLAKPVNLEILASAVRNALDNT